MPALTGHEPRQHRLDAASRPWRWWPGRSITGVETSFFDPIIEQVGLGPVERSDISAT